MERCVDPSLLWPADKPFSCRMETSHFPSLPSLRPTLGDSQTAGCVLKSIYNSNGQVIVCGELSFLLWRTMGAFLLWPVGSAAECRKHCLPKTPVFWGLMFSVMEMAISYSAEATDTYSRKQWHFVCHGEVRECTWHAYLQSTWKIPTWKQIIFVLWIQLKYNHMLKKFYSRLSGIF